MLTHYRQVVAASGSEFAESLVLTPACLSAAPCNAAVSSTLVVARGNVLRIFDVRDEEVLLQPSGGTRRDDDDEADVERAMMDDEMQAAFPPTTSLSFSPSAYPAPSARLYLVREHRLHGEVTGLAKIKTLASAEDGLDRLLISFRDAKLALMEWSEETNDLATVSLHTYERSEQIASTDSNTYRTRLRSDPADRCAALLLPRDALAILPIYSAQADLDVFEIDASGVIRDLPYSPSFVLPLASIDVSIKNVIDFAFLPGFHNPTVAVLCEPTLTWTGRLSEAKDTCRIFFITLDLVSLTYPLIAVAENLPYDSFALVPAPRELGGAILLTANAVMHVDQSGRAVGKSVNGWSRHTSELQLAPANGLTLKLEGAHAAFVDDSSLMLFLASGDVHVVRCLRDGRAVAGVEISEPVAHGTIPSGAVVLRGPQRAEGQFVFAPSMVGPSTLLRVGPSLADLAPGQENAAQTTLIADSMDVDLEEDLYGDSMPVVPVRTAAPTTNGHAGTSKAPEPPLRLCDTLLAHGPIHQVTLGSYRYQGAAAKQVVAATGAGHVGGIVAFHDAIPAVKKRKLNIGGSIGLWSFRLRRSSGEDAEGEEVIVTSDATPAPGRSRIVSLDAAGEVVSISRNPARTICASALFNETCVVQVLPSSVRLLEPNGNERQLCVDSKAKKAGAEIRSASVLDPYILIVRGDGSAAFLAGDTATRKLVKVDWPGEQPEYASGSVFSDTSGVFRLLSSTASPHAKGLGDVEMSNGTAHLANGAGVALNEQNISISSAEESRSEWVCMLTSSGALEIRALPSLALVWSSDGLSDLSSMLRDAEGDSLPPKATPSVPVEVHSVLLAGLGESRSRPHLLVLLKSGTLIVYEAFSTSSPAGRLAVGFSKLSTHILPSSSDHPQRLVSLGAHGAFLTGPEPQWICASDKAPARVHPFQEKDIMSAASHSVAGGGTGLLFFSEGEDPTLASIPDDLELGAEVPMRRLISGRSYDFVAFDPTTQMYCAASSHVVPFQLFDAEGNFVWKAPPGDMLSSASTYRSSLELLSASGREALAGYEFEQSEFITAFSCVSLQSASTTLGTKDVIAVGTTIARGEDLMVKGAIYIFEIAETVPNPHDPDNNYKLKLLCREEIRGAITAVSSVSGYIVFAVGQKILVRAFETDERLISVAFYDAGVFVTSIQVLKNLIILGDAVQSATLLAFQEDPFKLVLLSRDAHEQHVVSADFLVDEDTLAFVTNDVHGDLRLLEYNPAHPASEGGLKLITSSEFHTGAEARATTLVARQGGTGGPSSELILGAVDGSLACLVPLEERVAKRLSLLQGALVRQVQHVAALNPRAFRHVRNDYVSRGLSKGVLDGELLAAFERLARAKQDEITTQLGASTSDLLEMLRTCRWTL